MGLPVERDLYFMSRDGRYVAGRQESEATDADKPISGFASEAHDHGQIVT